MHSPLPDASALEAGIIEDERRTRLSRVQDNVRQLLRSSVISSVRSSFAARHAAQQPTVEDEPCSPYRDEPDEYPALVAETLLTPTSESSESSTVSSNSPDECVPFPPAIFQHRNQQLEHESTVFNSRAVVALNHPDLSDPSMALFLQQKSEARQKRAWKRSRNRKLRHATARQTSAGLWILCFGTGLLLAGIVATYLAITSTSTGLSTVFHILFILGILFSVIIFAYSIVRLCFLHPTLPSSPRVYVVSPSRSRHGGHYVRHRHRQHHRRRHHNFDRHHDQPLLGEGGADFVPPTPIPVHVVADEVRPDSREAETSAAAARASQLWDKAVPILENPPPAYGRWRGSVRANPDLLHWQVIPSPVDSDVPSLPSPTYEEAMNNRPSTAPPSYATRASPARERRVQEGAGLGVGQAHTTDPELFEPEMFEARDAGASRV